EPLAPLARRAPGRRAGLRRIPRAPLERVPGRDPPGRRAARRRAPASRPRARGRARADPRGGRAERGRPPRARDALRPGGRGPAARARRADPRLPQDRRRRGAVAPAPVVPIGADTRTLGRAAALAGVAALVAAAISLWGGPSLTALDWSVYDRWLRGRALVPDAPRLVIVTRDAASEARFGTGVWDRAVIAQAVAALGRAGAAVVGLDVPLGQPSAPGRGGATSDALLAQAMHGVDVVSVTPAGLPSTPSSARSDEKIGHAVAEPDPDGVVRAVPLWLR